MRMIIEQAIEQVNSGAAEVLLDFSAIPRIDAFMVAALENLAALAEQRSVPIVLRAVNADIYRVLKQLKLAQHFGFET